MTNSATPRRSFLTRFAASAAVLGAAPALAALTGAPTTALAAPPTGDELDAWFAAMKAPYKVVYDCVQGRAIISNDTLQLILREIQKSRRDLCGPGRLAPSLRRGPGPARRLDGKGYTPRYFSGGIWCGRDRENGSPHDCYRAGASLLDRYRLGGRPRTGPRHLSAAPRPECRRPRVRTGR